MPTGGRDIRARAEPCEGVLVLLAEIDVSGAGAPGSGGLLQREVERYALHVFNVNLVGVQVAREGMLCDSYIAVLFAERAIGCCQEREVVDLLVAGLLNIGVEEGMQAWFGVPGYRVGGEVQVDFRAVIEVGIEVPPLDAAHGLAIALAVFPGRHHRGVDAHALEILRFVPHPCRCHHWVLSRRGFSRMSKVFPIKGQVDRWLSMSCPDKKQFI